MTTVTAILAPGADRTLEADFSQATTTFGSSVSSINWSIVSGSILASLGTPSDNLVSSSSVVLLSQVTPASGFVVVQAEAVYADGQSASIWFELTYYDASEEKSNEDISFAVQDDTGSVDGANAYVSLVFFLNYCNQRGLNVSSYSTVAQQRAIIVATDYLDCRFRFVGEKRLGRDQTTEWPRTGVWDIDRYYITDIPLEVKHACCEYAFRALSSDINPDPVRDDTGRSVQSKSETVGPIRESVTYASGAVFQLPKYPAADNKLYRSGLVIPGGRLVRG